MPGNYHLHLADLLLPALQLVLAAADLGVALLGQLKLLLSIAVYFFLSALSGCKGTCFSSLFLVVTALLVSSSSFLTSSDLI